MLDQQLVDVFLQAAAKAAGTLTAKAGSSVIVDYLKQIDVGSKLLRTLGDWSKLKLTRHQHKKLIKYLDGKSCRALLELLAIAEISSVDENQKKEARQV